jgi:hypothetical protein
MNLNQCQEARNPEGNIRIKSSEEDLKCKKYALESVERSIPELSRQSIPI